MRSVSAPVRRPAVLEHLRVDAEIAVREITRELDEVEIVSPLYVSSTCFRLLTCVGDVATRCTGGDGGCAREGELCACVDPDVEECYCAWGTG